jgi:hypothetical protein
MGPSGASGRLSQRRQSAHASEADDRTELLPEYYGVAKSYSCQQGIEWPS